MKLGKKIAIRCITDEMNKISNVFPGKNISVGLVEYNGLDVFPVGMGYTKIIDAEMLEIGIGMAGFPGMFQRNIDMSMFCEMMLAVKHEEEHVRQFAEIYKQHTEESRNMALDHIATFYNPRYYRYNYGSMLHEIDANIEGIKNTRKYFQENYPDYDVEKALCEIVYRRQSSSPYTWMTAEHRKFFSVDDLIVSMKQHKRDVSEYRPHFTYPKRNVEEFPDRLEKYLEDSSRSFQLAWDDFDGLVQRNTAAQINLVEHLDDMVYFDSVCDKDVKLRGDIAEEKFELNDNYEEQEQCSL